MPDQAQLDTLLREFEKLRAGIHQTDQGKLDILLREYETLRAEILVRLKLAYQQLGWAGAAIAFAVPLAASDFGATNQHVALFVGKIGVAVLGVAILIRLSALNWSWLRACAEHIRRIEEVVVQQTKPAQLLTWERRSEGLTNGWYRSPKDPSTVNSPVPSLPKE